MSNQTFQNEHSFSNNFQGRVRNWIKKMFAFGIKNQVPGWVGGWLGVKQIQGSLTPIKNKNTWIANLNFAKIIINFCC